MNLKKQVNKTIFIFIITLLCFSQSYPVLAQTLAVSPTTSAEDKELIKQKIQERLHKVSSESSQSAKTVKPADQLLQEISNPADTNTQNQSVYFGEITDSAQENTLLLKTNQQSYKVTYQLEKTKLLLFKKAAVKPVEIKPEEIKEGWFAIAIGSFEKNKVLAATSIKFYSEEIANEQSMTLLGKVVEIDTKTVVIEDNNNLYHQITLPKNFTVKIKGVSKQILDNVNVGDKVVVVVWAKEKTTQDTETEEDDKPKEASVSGTKKEKNFAAFTYTLRGIYDQPRTTKTADETVNEATQSAESTQSAKKVTPVKKK